MCKQIFVFILYLNLYVLNTNTLLINSQHLRLTICYLTEFMVPLRQEGLIYFIIWVRTAFSHNVEIVVIY